MIFTAGGEPVWAAMAQVLRLVLYDYDALDTDDRIGEARVVVKDLKDQEEKDLWLDVDHHDPKEGNENRYKVGCLPLQQPYHAHTSHVHLCVQTV